MKNLILFILLPFYFVASFSAKAHVGGHYQNVSGAMFNTWQLKTGQIIKGNFSMSRDNTIFLEQENGRLLAIPIADLSAQDQKLAKHKIIQFGLINNVTYYQKDNFQSNKINSGYIFLFLFIILFFIVLNKINTRFFNNYLLNNKLTLSFVSFIFVTIIIVACSKSSTTNNSSSVTTLPSIQKTSTSFIDSAFSPYKPAISTKFDDTYFYIGSSGMPNHNMMIGITNWQQQVPIPQPYTDNNSWSIPLQPVYAAIPLSTKTNLMKGAVAIAVNGIPIFNALNNRGEDSYLIGELDNWGGHCGKGDDYHYHAAPLHLSNTSGLKPIAFALDGFAVYGSKEPDGSTMSSLDTCHGHIGVNSIYHYHGTTNYPYVIGAMKGKVNLDPSSTAPENQILPQAFTKPVRPATNPLKGASIIDFVSPSTNAYLLTYKIGSKNGYIKYNWDAANKFTFTLTDTAGVTITTTYQR